jgi:hypothetical protein
VQHQEVVSVCSLERVTKEILSIENLPKGGFEDSLFPFKDDRFIFFTARLG